MPRVNLHEMRVNSQTKVAVILPSATFARGEITGNECLRMHPRRRK